MAETQDLENIPIENAAYIEGLLAQYREAEHSIDSSWKPYFKALIPLKKIPESLPLHFLH